MKLGTNPIAILLAGLAVFVILAMPIFAAVNGASCPMNADRSGTCHAMGYSTAEVHDINTNAVTFRGCCSNQLPQAPVEDGDNEDSPKPFHDMCCCNNIVWAVSPPNIDPSQEIQSVSPIDQESYQFVSRELCPTPRPPNV